MMVDQLLGQSGNMVLQLCVRLLSGRYYIKTDTSTKDNVRSTWKTKARVVLSYVGLGYVRFAVESVYGSCWFQHLDGS